MEDSKPLEMKTSREKRDEDTLARMGKKQVLKRKFGPLSILGFSATILSTWEGILVTFGQGFLNGGTLGLLGQFVLAWGGTLSTFTAIGELASMAPTAGGQYHWVAMLSPRRSRNFLSYLTGWMNILAWVTTITTGSYWAASQIQSICIIDYPSYAPNAHGYQVTLILWAVVLTCIFINTIIGSYLPHLEGAFLIIHILGFFGILIPLTYYAPKSTAAEIFSEPFGHYNGGSWPTYGLSFMVGALGSATSFVGADAAVHLSEEISDADLNVPRSIFISIMLNGTLGFSMLIAVLFCMGNPQAALEAEQSNNYPFIEIFQSAVSSTAGATAMTSIITIIAFAATTGAAATASRMIWSFARDKGLPFHKTLTKVSPHSKIPVLAVLISAVIPCLLGLIEIGSTSVFQDVTSLTMTGFYSTYLICCVLLLYNRIKGNIVYAELGLQAAPAYRDEKTGDYVLTWGRWHVPGALGTINNVIAVCYLTTVGFFGFWPQQTPTDASNMNYAPLIFGATMLFSIAYWFAWGRRQYNGPIVEIVM